jgi:hypothetical protein
VNVTDIKGLVTFNIAVFQVVSGHFYFFTGRYWMFYERRGAVGEGVNEGVNALVELIKQRQGMLVPALAESMNTSPKNLERWLKQ